MIMPIIQLFGVSCNIGRDYRTHHPKYTGFVIFLYAFLLRYSMDSIAKKFSLKV